MGKESPLHYVVMWYARDPNGEKIMHTVKKRRYSGKVKKTEAGLNITGSLGGVLAPPFESRFGYKVRIVEFMRDNFNARFTVEGSRRLKRPPRP